MKLTDFEEMRKNAIRYEREDERRQRAIDFAKIIEDFNAYEEKLGDVTKMSSDYKWLDPADKRVKKVESAGDSVANILASAELREIFL